MIKYEVNKVTKSDVGQEVVDKLQYTPNTKEFDIEANKIADALYTGRNYTLPRLEAESIIANTTNLKQIKDLPNTTVDNRLVSIDTVQVIGKMVYERVQAENCNTIRKKDLTIENFKPLVNAAYINYFNSVIVYLPIGANYVSDKNPSELLRGTWELKAETKIGKIWERIA